MTYIKAADVGLAGVCMACSAFKKATAKPSAKQGARNFKFFDAPVGMFITIDSYLARGNWADVGMYHPNPDASGTRPRLAHMSASGVGFSSKSQSSNT